MESRFAKLEIVLIISILGYLTLPVAHAFNVGIRATACSLDPNENNPCKSIYNAECVAGHCKCTGSTFEDKTLKRCVPGSGTQGGDDLDLPFEYVPGDKPKPRTKTTKAPSQPAVPAQPQIPPAHPQPPVEDPHVAEKTGGGIGGGIGLLILAGLLYFCCCRGEKGKNLRSKLPFFKKGGGGGGGGGQPGANYQMQEPAPGQQPPPAV